MTARVTPLELDAQGEMAGAVAGVLCGLRSAEDAKGGIIDLRGGRSEVRVVEHIRECGLKAHFYSLSDIEDFGQAQAGRGCASLTFGSG